MEKWYILRLLLIKTNGFWRSGDLEGKKKKKNIPCRTIRHRTVYFRSLPFSQTPRPRKNQTGVDAPGARCGPRCPKIPSVGCRPSRSFCPSRVSGIWARRRRNARRWCDRVLDGLESRTTTTMTTAGSMMKMIMMMIANPEGNPWRGH